VHNARAHQDTFFFKTTNHTAYPDFQTDVRGPEATLPCPGVRSAFQDVLHLYDLIRPYCSLIFNPCNIMFYTRINKVKVFNNRKGFLGLFNRSAELHIYRYVSVPEQAGKSRKVWKTPSEI
jgi:hypothetical protein